MISQRQNPMDEHYDNQRNGHKEHSCCQGKCEKCLNQVRKRGFNARKETFNRPLANKRSRGTKSAMLQGKLIIIPALGHQNKGKPSFTGSGLFVCMPSARDLQALQIYNFRQQQFSMSLLTQYVDFSSIRTRVVSKLLYKVLKKVNFIVLTS